MIATPVSRFAFSRFTRRRPRFVAGFRLVLAGLALGLAACAPAPVAETDAAGTSAPAAAGKILRVGTGAEPQDLDPQVVSGALEHDIIKTLIEGLVIDHPSGQGVLPGVAERWETSADGLVWTFHLRAEARWSNGDPVTAEDFVGSYQRILTPSIASPYAYFLYAVVGAEEFNQGLLADFTRTGFQAPDARTLVIRLKSPVPFLLESLKHNAWWPVHLPTVEKFGGLTRPGTAWPRVGNFVGNGPFALKEWLPNQYLLATRSPTYWNTAATKIEGIQFFPFDDANARERAFRTGRLDSTTLPPIKIGLYREKHPDEYRTSPRYETSFIHVNTTRRPFDDVRVRRAFALALDRNAFVRFLKADHTPALNLTPASAIFRSRHQLAPDGKARLDEARRLLAEAGYPEGRDFPAVSLLYVTSNLGKEMSEIFQQMWRAGLGVEVRLRNEEWKVYLDSQVNQAFDLCLGGWTADYADPHTFLDMWITGGGNNHTGYANPDYDRLLASALQAPDEAARMEIYQQLDGLLVRDLPIIPTIFPQSVYALNPRVKNWNPDLMGKISWQSIELGD